MNLNGEMALISRDFIEFGGFHFSMAHCVNVVDKAITMDIYDYCI